MFYMSHCSTYDKKLKLNVSLASLFSYNLLDGCWNSTSYFLSIVVFLYTPSIPFCLLHIFDLGCPKNIIHFEKSKYKGCKFQNYKVVAINIFASGKLMVLVRKNAFGFEVQCINSMALKKLELQRGTHKMGCREQFFTSFVSLCNRTIFQKELYFETDSLCSRNKI